MYGKLLDRNRRLVEGRLDDMLKVQRHAVDRIVQRYRRLGAVLLDPGVSDDELRTRLLSIVPEEQLREDQSDLANWTRGDRKARFEQTAERHAGLSQFAAPFSEPDEVRRRAGRGSVADAVGATGLPRTPRGGAPHPVTVRTPHSRRLCTSAPSPSPGLSRPWKDPLQGHRAPSWRVHSRLRRQCSATCASTESLSTPRPSAYMYARLPCAGGKPCLAARRNH